MKSIEARITHGFLTFVRWTLEVVRWTEHRSKNRKKSSTDISSLYFACIMENMLNSSSHCCRSVQLKLVKVRDKLKKKKIHMSKWILVNLEIKTWLWKSTLFPATKSDLVCCFVFRNAFIERWKSVLIITERAHDLKKLWKIQLRLSGKGKKVGLRPNI